MWVHYPFQPTPVVSVRREQVSPFIVLSMVSVESVAHFPTVLQVTFESLMFYREQEGRKGKEFPYVKTEKIK